MSLSSLFVSICPKANCFSHLCVWSSGYFYLQIYSHEYQMMHLMGPRPERTRGYLGLKWEVLGQNHSNDSLNHYWNIAGWKMTYFWVSSKNTMQMGWYCLFCNQIIRWGVLLPIVLTFSLVFTFWSKVISVCWHVIQVNHFQWQTFFFW